MNLTKLFNFNFFKENIKKSKGFVCLLLLVVPIFTLLVILLGINNTDMITVIDKSELIIVNIIGMYIVPVLLSFVLFGYVYKKNSVDFINSQPINRKSIFITNSLGGALLITIMQIITAIILIICGLILPKIIIIPQLVFDVFIMMWISYLFVFFATNLAMTVSGTFLTQIALTMLILFLVPFCVDGFNRFSNSDVYQFKNIEQLGYFNNISSDDTFTMPYRVLHSIVETFTMAEFDWYSIHSICKMIILGIIYYILGKILFQRRKMENNEESFFNEKIHIIVKALTLIPVFIILNIIKAEKEINIFIIALAITYYFVYDFIVKRKIKFKNSLVYLVISLIALQGFCVAGEKIKENMPKRNIDYNDISALTIYSPVYDSMYYENYEFSDYIENKDIIKEFLNSASYFKNNVIEEEEKAYIHAVLRLKTGRNLYANLILLEKDYNNILQKINNDEQYKERLKQKILENGNLLVSNIKILEGSEKKFVFSEIEKEIDKYSVEDLLNINNTDGTCINNYYYKNHKLVVTSIKDKITPNVLQIVSKYENAEFLKYFNDNKQDQFWNPHYSIVEKTDNDRIYIDYFNDQVTNIIKSNNEKTLDVSKPYYVIFLQNLGEIRRYYINTTDDIKEIIDQEIAYDKTQRIDIVK